MRPMGEIEQASVQVDDAQLKEVTIVASPVAVPHAGSESSLSDISGNGERAGGRLPINGAYTSSYRCRRVASKTVLSFHSKDPEDPVNWSKDEGEIYGMFYGGDVRWSYRWTANYWLYIGGKLALEFLVLLQRRARKLRKETGDDKIVAALDLEKKGIKETMTVTLTRPLRMILFESIVLFTCLYLSLVYAIFFMYFQTYPIIFQRMYHMNPGVAGLMYLPIGVGVALALGLFYYWDNFLHRAKLRHAPWSSVEEYRRLPLAGVGGPLFVVALLWLGWTASPNIHWSVPMFSGIPFGAGFLLIFIAMINYLSDAYETYSASAQSAASFARSILGTALPIAAGRMYAVLGVSWGCSLLAFASLAMTAVPFAFIRYGNRIRAGSRFCQHLKELKEQRMREDEEEEASNRAAGQLTDNLDISEKV
ncbi:polyamine transporter 3 [Arthroderma uncinatum]|uniref:polyamine transporter 3 n=1 Tax=Arthroderma uncinatum TaxID=74035 RepID=UPI00144A5C0F|nr:polyamine transporter 3 [Arthroderma uncinatum]KAF3481214.1 polyamine transporter 3 [Arthroderma uncinatum]